MSSQKMIFRAEHCRLNMTHFYFIFSCLEIDRISGITTADGGLCVCVRVCVSISIIYSVRTYTFDRHTTSSFTCLLYPLLVVVTSFYPVPHSCLVSVCFFLPWFLVSILLPFIFVSVAFSQLFLCLFASSLVLSYSFSSLLFFNRRCWTLRPYRLMHTQRHNDITGGDASFPVAPHVFLELMAAIRSVLEMMFRKLLFR